MHYVIVLAFTFCLKGACLTETVDLPQGTSLGACFAFAQPYMAWRMEAFPDYAVERWTCREEERTRT
jgi:hypothetical protein